MKRPLRNFLIVGIAGALIAGMLHRTLGLKILDTSVILSKNDLFLIYHLLWGIAMGYAIWGKK